MASSACLNPIREKAGLLGDVPGLRPADVFIPNLWDSPIAIDFAVTCPMQARYNIPSNPVEIYAKQVKHRKYDKEFKKTNILFIAAVADTFGSWTEERERIIAEVARRGAKRMITDDFAYISLCWQRLSVSLQKDCANMLLSRINN